MSKSIEKDIIVSVKTFFEINCWDFLVAIDGRFKELFQDNVKIKCQDEQGKYSIYRFNTIDWETTNNNLDKGIKEICEDFNKQPEFCSAFGEKIEDFYDYFVNFDGELFIIDSIVFR